ncbi:metal-dependent hydrolase [Nakamurella silvestris]|nr:metal-dependent hydrolase [Nakamurella silvestris]
MPTTIVTYPAGEVSGTATVLAVADAGDGRSAVIVDRTPFHPVDHRWPDQGPDRGAIAAGDRRLEVVDVVLGAVANTNTVDNTGTGNAAAIHLGEQIPVRRGEDGWSFLVAHIVADQPPALGETVLLQVDPDHRRALSAGHTGCHVAALALNAVLADRWLKDIPVDGVGSPDFDGQANTTSRITPGGSVDTYRLGKSLRKRGFNAEGIEEALPGLAERANALLAEWVAVDAPVSWEIAGPALTDLRTWICTLPEGEQRMACGGTHLHHLGELARLQVSFSVTDAELTMVTTAILADS